MSLTSDADPVHLLVLALDEAHDLIATAVADFAAASFGTSLAGLALAVPGGPPVRLMVTHPRLLEVDDVLRRVGEGPGLQALAGGDVVTVGDTRSDERWPRWSRAVARAGLRSVQVMGMAPLRGLPVVLDLYAARPDAFTSGRAPAGGSARVLGTVLRRLDQVQHLQEALASRTLIGQAQGILMERHSLGAEQAMDYLKRLSQESQTKVRDLAERLAADPDVEGRDDPAPQAQAGPGTP